MADDRGDYRIYEGQVTQFDLALEAGFIQFGISGSYGLLFASLNYIDSIKIGYWIFAACRRDAEGKEMVAGMVVCKKYDDPHPGVIDDRAKAEMLGRLGIEAEHPSSTGGGQVSRLMNGKAFAGIVSSIEAASEQRIRIHMQGHPAPILAARGWRDLVKVGDYLYALCAIDELGRMSIYDAVAGPPTPEASREFEEAKEAMFKRHGINFGPSSH